jgi:hypothetical protein
MKTLSEQLADAEAEAARLKRAIAVAPCDEVGHRWKFLGGRNAGCDDEDHREFSCSCSVPVYECEACGDCDYGENDEAREIVAECKARRDEEDFPE